MQIKFEPSGTHVKDQLKIRLDFYPDASDKSYKQYFVEVAVGGYARKALVSSGTGAAGQDFYINKPAAYYRADSKVVEWTATADYVTAQKNINLCTDATAVTDAANKHLICALALSATRTILNGDKLDGSVYIGLSNYGA